MGGEKAGPLGLVDFQSRITPAWAGKRKNLDAKTKQKRDHPRMGGEKQAHRIAAGRPLGSPPHGRGKAAPSAHTEQRARITPAWAGKRRLSMLGCAASGDHPRMGGEKYAVACWADLPQGSPPHGRGKGGSASGAGSPCEDHPRMGGEKQKVAERAGIALGSPPHGRGKVSFYCVTVVKSGITPAWAGKRFVTVTVSLFWRDHPRMGGEKRTPTG